MALERSETDWVEIGEITTMAGTFAIIDPSLLGLASDHWHGIFGEDGEEEIPSDYLGTTFAQLLLPEPFRALLLFTGEDATWPVEARFADMSGTGQLELLEVRIVFYEPDDEEGEQDAALPG